MFTISNADFQSSRSRNTGEARNPEMTPDATQRVHIPSDHAANSAVGQRRPAQASGSQRPSQKERNITIILIAVAAVLLIALIITLIVAFKKPKDDGLILDNVFAAGVDLSGMTQEAAKDALSKATDDTYTELDMVIQILNETVTLSPADTKVRLDVDAVVEAALSYGRTGSQSDRQKDKNLALTSSYTVPIIEYLNLDTDYINEVLDALGKKYSTTLSQPTVSITGDRPSMTQSSYDTSVTYQTLSIYVGTAEYGLSIDTLYEQILDAYNTNLFQVAAQCSIVAPDAVDVDALYSQHCTAPVDADIDENYNTTPEKYGYGFDLEEVKAQVSDAEYGTTLEIPLHFIAPNVTEEDLSGDLFQNILGQASTVISSENDRADLTANLTNVCNALNGLVLKSGDSFSFNSTVGQLTTGKGYCGFEIYVGTELKNVVGGGVSQAASTLYYAAIQAELTITERHHHYYAPTFIEAGLDADIDVENRTKDLRFTNTTSYPIRIEAYVENGKVNIILWGTDDRDYTVGIVNDIVRTYEPVTLVQTLAADNPRYGDGKILEEGIVGYDIITYKTYLYAGGATSGTEEYEVGQSHYEKRNQIVVAIATEPAPDPSDPTDTTDPVQTTDPSETTQPSESIPEE